MKKTVLFVLTLCLCFTAIGAAFAETAQAEATGTETAAAQAPAAEKQAAEMTAEELYQAGLEALDAKDYGKALVKLSISVDTFYSRIRSKYASTDQLALWNC